MLSLPDSLLEAAQLASRGFPLRVPRGFVARMRQGDPNDPLLLQVLPLHAELESVDAGIKKLLHATYDILGRPKATEPVE